MGVGVEGGDGVLEMVDGFGVLESGEVEALGV